MNQPQPMFATHSITVLLVIISFVLVDNGKSWFGLSVDGVTKTQLMVCLIVIGLYFQQGISPRQSTLISWIGLSLIALLLLWSLGEKWNHILIQPDSRSYIRNEGYRTPLYPWFIDLLTLGQDLRASGSLYYGPIGQLIINGDDSPLIWPIRIQQIILHASLVTVTWVMSRITGPLIAVVTGFIILFEGFLSYEQNQLLTECLTQALTLFTLAAYFLFVLEKKLKWLLAMSLLFGLAFLMRPAAGYLILLPIVGALQYTYYHRFRLRVILPSLFMCMALPIIGSAGIQASYQYVKTGVWSPVPYWAEKKMAIALQIAGIDDIEKLRDLTEYEFLKRALELKWQEDWKERRYLRRVLYRDIFRHPERGYEFSTRNHHVIISPIASAMSEERSLSDRQEQRFKHNLMLRVANAILEDPQHQAQRQLMFLDALRDTLDWQHRIKSDWPIHLDIVGIATLMLFLVILTRNTACWMGLLCMALHIISVILFCWSNTVETRYTHATELLFVLGAFLVLWGFLKEFVLLKPSSKDLIDRHKPRGVGLLLGLTMVIAAPSIANVRILDKWMPDHASLHGVPIVLDLAVRRLGQKNAIEISKTLRDDPTTGRRMLRESGLFRTPEECELLTGNEKSCNDLNDISQSNM